MGVMSDPALRKITITYLVELAFECFIRKQDKIQASTTLALAVDGCPPGKHADKNMMLIGDVGVELAQHARPDPAEKMGSNEMNTVGGAGGGPRG